MLYLIDNKYDPNILKFSNKNDVYREFEANPFLRYLIYVNDDSILGFLCYQDIIDRYEIDNLFVNVNNRNLGIASQLMDELIRTGINNKIKNITLEVKKDNYIAINLYKKKGFAEKAIRKNYYGNIDGILMEKEMK